MASSLFSCRLKTDSDGDAVTARPLQTRAAAIPKARLPTMTGRVGRWCSSSVEAERSHRRESMSATWWRLCHRFQRYAVARPSVVCNARAPYSGGCNFRQFFYDIWYPGHPLTCTENFMEIVPGEPLRRGGELNPRGVAKYSDFGPIEGYVSETVEDRM